MPRSMVRRRVSSKVPRILDPKTVSPGSSRMTPRRRRVPPPPRPREAADVLTADVVEFLTELEREFGARRLELLARRKVATAPPAHRRAAGLPSRDGVDQGGGLARRAGPGRDLQDRRVEITGPGRPQDGHQRAQLRRAASSWPTSRMPPRRPGATASSGQRNLTTRVARTIAFDSPDGKQYALNDRDGDAPRPAARLAPGRAARHRRRRAVSGGLFDFGLYFFHNAQELIERGTVRTSTCRSWRATSKRACGTTSSCFAQDALGIPRGTISATVLIETILAAFEMDEILYELRDHSAGLNAGRWDYIFSVIKKFAQSARVRAPRPRRR